MLFSRNKEQKVQYHKWLGDDHIKIKVMRMSRGYQWELTYEAEDTLVVMARLKEADTLLREIYGEQEAYNGQTA